MRFLSWKFVAVLCLLCPSTLAQVPAALTLGQITASAGYIFAGTVTGEHVVLALYPPSKLVPGANLGRRSSRVGLTSPVG